MEPWSLPDPAGAAGIAVAAALGLILGSFANVCIHRIPEGRSVVWPGSACPACAVPIRWYDNVPVLSWLLLGGRCRACRGPIPVTYPAIEAATAILLVALFLRHGPSFRWVSLSWLAVSIVILVPIDLRHGILPDRITLPGLAAGLLASVATPDPGPAGALAGAAAGGLVPLAIRALYIAWVRLTRGRQREGAEDGDLADQRREGMGLGDVKMLAMTGAFLGAPRVMLTMLLGSLIGTLYVLPTLATGRRDMKTPVPFGPFLGVAALISMFWGAEIIDWYLGLVIALPLAD